MTSLLLSRNSNAIASFIVAIESNWLTSLLNTSASCRGVFTSNAMVSASM